MLHCIDDVSLMQRTRDCFLIRYFRWSQVDGIRLSRFSIKTDTTITHIVFNRPSIPLLLLLLLQWIIAFFAEAANGFR